MPTLYIVREFSEDNFYHVFNRGIERRIVFQDETDYKILLYYLRVYLVEPELLTQKYPQLPIRLLFRNLREEIDLLAYCLMPNHYHLLLYTKTKTAIPQLMKQLSNAYTRYFNEKYNRVGTLFQGRYKAVRITNDDQLIHLSRYIHLNPLVAKLSTKLENYPWSSYSVYSGISTSSLIHTDIIKSHFQNNTDYIQFVKNQEDYAKTLNELKHLTIELI